MHTHFMADITYTNYFAVLNDTKSFYIVNILIYNNLLLQIKYWNSICIHIKYNASPVTRELFVLSILIMYLINVETWYSLDTFPPLIKILRRKMICKMFAGCWDFVTEVSRVATWNKYLTVKPKVPKNPKCNKTVVWQ